MSQDYSPSLVTKSLVFCGDAAVKSSAGPGTRLYDRAGVDSANVKLLIHGNEGSGQSFTDSSLSNHAITAVGNVTHSTTKSKFSGGSIYYDDSGDYLSIPASTDWVFSGDFTIDFWCYIDSTQSSGYSHFFTLTSQSVMSFKYSLLTNAIYLYTGGTDITCTVDLEDAWHHVALVRSGTGSNNLQIFVDGVSQVSASKNDTWGNATGTAYIGWGWTTEWFKGYMDEMRVTQGAALWTQDFNPPARRDTLSINDGMMYNGTCFDFDGTDDKVVTNNAVITGTGDFTFTAWINKATVNTTDFICGNYGAGNSGGVEFYVSGGTVLRCYIGGNYTTGSLSMVEDTWYHVAVTRTSGTLQNYINAATDGAAIAAGASITGSNNFSIGNGADYTSENMDGKIADVKAFDIALSAANIKELYDDSKVIIPTKNAAAGGFVSQANLKGWWPLAEGAGDICYDGSGNGYHGIVSNEDGDEWLTGKTGAPQLVEGYNRPMQFDVDGYVDMALTLNALTDYTFSWWSRSTSQDNRQLFASGGQTSGAFHLNFYGTTNKPLLYLAGNNYSYWADNAAQDDGQWHHWLLTYEGTATSDEQAQQSELYIDGVLISRGSYTNSAAPNTWGTFRIGRGNSGGIWQGGLNEFIIYNGQLGSSERAQLYARDVNGGPLPPDPMSLSNSSDVLGYWRNDGNVTWTDRSGNGYTGTVSGSPDVLLFKQGYNGSASTSTGRDGQGFPLLYQNNGAIGFNGSDNYVDCGNSSAFSFGDGSSDSPFTVGAWINMDDATNFGIISKGAAWTDAEYFFMVSGSDKLDFTVLDNSVSAYEKAIYNTALTSYEGQWIYVVATYSGVGGTSANAGISLYLNGSQLATTLSDSGTYVAMEDLSGAFRMGRYSTDYGKGQIANTQIYNRVLTQAEIKQNFEAQAQRFQVPRWGNRAIIQDSLEAWFDAGISESYPGSGSTWYDISGNDKDYGITFDTGGGFSETYGGLIYFGSGTTGSGAFYASSSNSIFNVATSTATMSFWVRKKATSTHGSDMFTMDRDDANGVRIFMTAASSGSIYFNTNSQSDQLVAGTTFYMDIWYNVVCTLDSTEKKIYINGVLDGSQTVSATTISRSGSTEDTIGNLGSSASNGYQFKGDFASAVFYRRALTAEEVSQNFKVQRQRFGI